MSNKSVTYAAVTVILIFVVYMIWDTASFRNNKPSEIKSEASVPTTDKWEINKTLMVSMGNLRSVAVTDSGSVVTGGESFVSYFDRDLNLKWQLEMENAVTALATGGDIIYAAAGEVIILLTIQGEIIEEWGPFEANSLITSISANSGLIAFADAVNKRIFILGRDGVVVRMLGQSDNNFLIPSPYFDVVLLDDNTILAANTGRHRVERWDENAVLTEYFGTPGTAPDSFCGCCNPAHMALAGDYIVTAEKGINRIKILRKNGEFVEYVSSDNNFTNSVPLDLAASDDKIFAANPADSKLYIFKRK